MTKEFNLFEQDEEDLSVATQTEPLSEEKILLDAIGKLQALRDDRRVESEALIHTKRIVEALLFASNEPIPFNRMRDIVETAHPIKPRHLNKILSDLQDEYLSQGHSFRLEEIAQGWVLRSANEYTKYIDMLYRHPRSEKLSQAATEVLAIIAHRGPITRPQIDAIRGVDSSGTVYALVERGLIEATGKLETAGRPTLYGVTQEFLKYYGLRDLSELPALKKQTGNQ
jgi:segregation and condensation protein B